MSAKAHKFRLVHHGTMNTPLIPGRPDSWPHFGDGSVKSVGCYCQLSRLSPVCNNRLRWTVLFFWYSAHFGKKQVVLHSAATPEKESFLGCSLHEPLRKKTGKLYKHIWKLSLSRIIHLVCSGTWCVLVKLCKIFSGDDAFTKSLPDIMSERELGMILKCRIMIGEKHPVILQSQKEAKYPTPRRYRGKQLPKSGFKSCSWRCVPSLEGRATLYSFSAGRLFWIPTDPWLDHAPQCWL